MNVAFNLTANGGTILERGTNLIAVPGTPTIQAIGNDIYLSWSEGGAQITKQYNTVTDNISVNGGATFVGTGAQLLPSLQTSVFVERSKIRLIYANHSVNNNPGNGVNTTENQVAGLDFTIPGNSIGPNGTLIIQGIFEWTGTGNHNIKIKIGGVTVFNISPTTNVQYFFRVTVRNNNSMTAQFFAAVNTTPGAEDRGAHTAVVSTAAINMAVDQPCITTIFHTVAGDTSWVKSLEVFAVN